MKHIRLFFFNIVLFLSMPLFVSFLFAQAPINIQKKIDNAKDGSIIKIPDGTYYITEPISIEERKNLKIVFGKDTKIISKSKENSILELYNCEKIILQNGIFGYNMEDIKSEYAIHIEECEIIVFEKCQISSVNTTLFNFYSSDNIAVSECNIRDSGAMLSLDLVSNPKIVNNRIENTPIFPKGASLDTETKQLLKTITAKNKIISKNK